MADPSVPHTPTVTQKPWGSETLFAAVEGSYVGKIIALRSGEAVSLQRHHEKTETLTVLSGDLEIEVGDHPDELHRRTLAPGDCLHIPAQRLHRFTAVTDVTFVEVSTAAPGWQNDVERLEDRYGRIGSDRP